MHERFTCLLDEIYPNSNTDRSPRSTKTHSLNGFKSYPGNNLNGRKLQADTVKDNQVVGRCNNFVILSCICTSFI